MTEKNIKDNFKEVKAVNHRKIKKKDFEKELFEKYCKDGKPLEYSPYDEFDHETHLAKRLYLYYKNGVHIGTWMKGKGWEFKKEA